MLRQNKFNKSSFDREWWHKSGSSVKVQRISMLAVWEGNHQGVGEEGK